MRSFLAAIVLAASASLVSAISTPPSGALIVRGSDTQTGEYSTISAAVTAAGTGSAAAVIFIYPGTYTEQVFIEKTGNLTIIGSSTDDSTYESNTVTLTNSLDATTAGSDDASGTLRVHKSTFTMYNVNVANTYGTSTSHLQAIALSAYGSEQQYLGCSFVGYQDTILTETGTQLFSACFIQGAVDFIFGQYSSAWFHRSHISSIGPGAITASGRASDDDGVYVFNSCYIEEASDADSETSGNVYLGRPWADYARVIFQDSSLGSHINAAGWEQWSTSTARTDHVTFGEYANTGSGASTTSRASFATQLSSAWSMSTVLGSGYTSWTNSKYLA